MTILVLLDRELGMTARSCVGGRPNDCRTHWWDNTCLELRCLDPTLV